MNKNMEISNQIAVLDFEFEPMTLSEFLQDSLENLDLFVEKTHVKESLTDFLTANIEDLQMTLDLKNEEVKQIEAQVEPMLSYTQKIPEYEIDFDDALIEIDFVHKIPFFWKIELRSESEKIN